MQFDGPKRKGRFLKGKSRVLEKVALSDFAFAPLEAVDNITPDNAVRNIIHSKYHEKAELDRGVKTPASFDTDLLPQQQRRSVIFPLDFTKDWERSRKLSKDRLLHRDDEDYDLEQSLGTTQHDDEDESREAVQLAQQRIKAGAPPPAVKAPKAAPVLAEVKSPLEGPIEKAPYASMDAVSSAIKSLRPGTEAFIPTSAPPSAEGVTTTTHVAVDPEVEAAETYKQRVVERQLDEEAVKKAFEEARDRGYQEGYTGGFKDGHSQGEEKAELASRQHANALFGKVGELIHEFSGLKHEILNNVQENFYELAQAMAEALLKREFSIRPEAFVSVLRKAIDEAVEPGKFKIKVHPDTFSHVEGVAPADIVEALIKDSNLEPGDFRIESSLSVVDVNIRSMLKELLDQADLTLFGTDQAEKAS